MIKENYSNPDSIFHMQYLQNQKRYGLSGISLPTKKVKGLEFEINDLKKDPITLK